MPLIKDVAGGGINADGTRSTEYCSLCYKYGEFCDTFMEASEMQDFVKDKLEEQGYGRFMRWLMTRDIPSLGRWKKKTK